MVDDYADPEKALADMRGQAVSAECWNTGGTITGGSRHRPGEGQMVPAVGEGAFHLHELVKSALDPRIC